MHHQQARSTPSTVNSTPPLPERTGKGRWKCAAGSGGRDPHRDDLTGEESKQILEQYIAVLNPKVSDFSCRIVSDFWYTLVMSSDVDRVIMIDI